MNLVKDIIAIRSEDFYQFHGVLINGRKVMHGFCDESGDIGHMVWRKVM